MELVQQISKACNIRLEDTQNELDCERNYLQGLIATDSLDYDDVMQSCMALGIEDDFDTIALLLL